MDYTIVIPHHKSLPLLIRAIESIPERNDIQIIVIDDNSNLNKEDLHNLNKLLSFSRHAHKVFSSGISATV